MIHSFVLEGIDLFGCDLECQRTERELQPLVLANDGSGEKQGIKEIHWPSSALDEVHLASWGIERVLPGYFAYGINHAIRNQTCLNVHNYSTIHISVIRYIGFGICSGYLPDQDSKTG